MKKRYRFLLAIVVPQSWSHLHSGDRLFEWPKLSERKITNESTFDEIYNSTPTQTSILWCTQIFHNLMGWKCIVCIVFALPRLFDEFNHFTKFCFFNVRLIKKWVVLHGLKLWKLDSFLEPFRWRTIEFIREFWSVRLKISQLRTSQTIGQFWAQCTVWSKRKAFLRFDNFI